MTTIFLLVLEGAFDVVDVSVGINGLHLLHQGI